MSASPTPYVNFKVLRKGLSFEAVLKHYGIEVRRQAKGNRHVGFCPLPTHQGQRRSPSFSAKLDWGVWQCFGCKASGNVLDFAVRMEGLDPANHQDLRKVALKLQEIFKVPGAGEPPRSPPASKEKPGREPERKPPPPPQSPPAAPPAMPVVINPPLDFELKNLDPDHPYLRERGFTPETICQFGLGYCNRGLMAGRVVIPIHDAENRLVGYAGRLVDDARVNESNPKYKFPGPRERDGKRIEFHASRLLYNANRLTWPLQDVVVVKGFPSVWWLTQHGFANVVALMGSSCSEAQARIITSGLTPQGRAWILSDGDLGGVGCAESVFMHVAPHRWVRWVKLPQGQPKDYGRTDLQQYLPPF